MWQRLGTRSIEDLADLPPIDDPECRATLDVLTSLPAPARFTDQNLSRLVAGRMADLSLEHGNSDASCLAYVWVGQLLTVFGEFQAGFRFGRLGLRSGRMNAAWTASGPACTSFSCIRQSLEQSPATGVEWLRRAFEPASKPAI